MNHSNNPNARYVTGLAIELAFFRNLRLKIKPVAPAAAAVPSVLQLWTAVLSLSGANIMAPITREANVVQKIIE